MLSEFPAGFGAVPDTRHERGRLRGASGRSAAGGRPPGGGLCLLWSGQKHPAPVQTGNGFRTSSARRDLLSLDNQCVDSLGSVFLQPGSLQVCSTSVKVFTVFWTSMPTDWWTSLWEHWEQLSSSGQPTTHTNWVYLCPYIYTFL